MDVSLVMPVYDEEALIVGVVRAWAAELERLELDYELRLYDDGSRDATPSLLDDLARQSSRIVVVHQGNRGHGPTVLRGYREARGEWIFQVDSDDELPVEGFAELWTARESYDVLMGWRRHRRSSAPRRLVTEVSRLAVRLLFGGGVRDVNTPYRLIRRETLMRLLPLVPDDAFAPNVILSGLVAQRGLRLFQLPVTHHERRAGQGSLSSARLWKGAARSLLETVRVACSSRFSRRGDR